MFPRSELADSSGPNDRLAPEADIGGVLRLLVEVDTATLDIDMH